MISSILKLFCGEWRSLLKRIQNSFPAMSRFCQKFAQNMKQIEKTQGKLSQDVFQLREIEEQLKKLFRN